MGKPVKDALLDEWEEATAHLNEDFYGVFLGQLVVVLFEVVVKILITQLFNNIVVIGALENVVQFNNIRGGHKFHDFNLGEQSGFHIRIGIN